MQCCARCLSYLQKTNKHPNFERRGQGRGADSFVSWRYPIWIQCLNNFVADCSCWATSWTEGCDFMARKKNHCIDCILTWLYKFSQGNGLIGNGEIFWVNGWIYTRDRQIICIICLGINLWDEYRGIFGFKEGRRKGAVSSSQNWTEIHLCFVF